MNLESLKKLLEGFDVSKLLPELGSVLGWVELMLRLAVLAGPILMLLLGLIYLLAPPREANYSLGFRCWWGMSSLEAWQFTQKLGGIVFSALGLVLTVVMSLICAAFRDMEPMDMAFSALKCLLWELGLAAAAVLAVNGVLLWAFDRRGYRRNHGKTKTENEADHS